MHALRISLLAGMVCTANAVLLSVPGQHPTIQASLEAARPGDTILVDPGIYRERIRLKEKVILRSRGEDDQGILGLKRAELTIIEGGGREGEGSGVVMAEGSTLDGFTVRHVGEYDDAEWNRHHASKGEDQSHEQIGRPGPAGIEVKGVDCVVRNNIVHHNGYTGIAIEGMEGKECSPLVERNICHRNMGGGIGSMNQSSALIVENICFQNFYAGIGHNHASPKVLNNRCYENIRAGIGISEDSSPLVRGNQCHHNRRAGIGIRSGSRSWPVLENNDCHDNEMAGIGFGECERGRATLTGNRVVDNGLVAVGIHRGWKVGLTGNEFSRQGGLPPIIMVFEGAEATLVDNKIRGGGVAGLRVEGRVMARGNDFIGTSFRKGGPPNFAIWALAGSQMAMSGNQVSGWRHALRAREAEVSASGNKVSQFHQAAFVIDKPSGSIHVQGNLVVASDPSDQILLLDGKQEKGKDNRLVAP